VRARRRRRPSRPGAAASSARRDHDQATEGAAERGREADSPSQIPKPGWRDILLRAWRELGDDHVSLIAAAVAFCGLLFPAIAVLISIWALALDPLQIEQQIGTLSAMLPPDAAAIIKEQAHKVAADVGGMSVGAVVGILLALYGAAKGIKALTEDLNIIYDERRSAGLSD
jgi:membrane protein